MFEICTTHQENTVKEHLAEGGGQRRLHELLSELNHNRCEQLTRPKKGAFQSLGTTGWSKIVLQWIAETQTLLAKDPDTLSSCAEIRLE